MLSVVIPAYNEAAGIGAVVARVLATRPALAAVGLTELELLVVDDGSSDSTAAQVAAVPGVRVLRHAHNQGYGAALLTGFAAARGEWIGFLDADGTYPPECFPALYTAACAQQADLVVGSRLAGAASQMPPLRRLGNRLFAAALSVLSAQRVSDAASGMRLLRAAALPRLLPLPAGLNLTPVMSTRALHEQVRLIEVPIPYAERQGRSKLRVVGDGLRFAQSMLWTALHYNPAQPLGLVGLGCLGVAGLVGLGLVAARLGGQTEIGPLAAFALFAALGLAVAGASLLTLGAAFNAFVALFHRRPVRQPALGRLHLERYAGGLGLLGLGLGVGLGGLSLGLGLAGWPVSRLWLYYLAAACLGLLGVQGLVGWVQLQVLAALQAQAGLAAADHRPSAPAPAAVPSEPAEGRVGEEGA